MNTNEKNTQKTEDLTVLETEVIENPDQFTYTFKKPVTYHDIKTNEIQIIDTMTFDLGKLTGQDSLAVENELQALGITAMIPAFSGEYLIRIAAKASEPKVGSDFFGRLSLHEFNKIRSAVRSFLLRSE